MNNNYAEDETPRLKIGWRQHKDNLCCCRQKGKRGRELSLNVADEYLLSRETRGEDIHLLEERESKRRVDEEETQKLNMMIENRVDGSQDTAVIRDEHMKLRRWLKILMATVVVAWVVGFVASGSGSTDEAPIETSIHTSTPTTTQTSPSTSPQIASRTPAQEDRLQNLTEILSGAFDESFPSSDLQEEALLWLAYDDPANLSFSDTEPDILLERFIMVLFFLSTARSQSNNWLSNLSVCFWEGVGCNPDSGQITDLLQCE